MTLPQPPVAPPDPPMECTWCDGSTHVWVDSVETVDGSIEKLPRRFGNLQDAYQIDCPHCEGAGDEPPTDDNPNVP